MRLRQARVGVMVMEATTEFVRRVSPDPHSLQGLVVEHDDLPESLDMVCRDRTQDGQEGCDRHETPREMQGVGRPVGGCGTNLRPATPNPASPTLLSAARPHGEEIVQASVAVNSDGSVEDEAFRRRLCHARWWPRRPSVPKPSSTRERMKTAASGRCLHVDVGSKESSAPKALRSTSASSRPAAGCLRGHVMRRFAGEKDEAAHVRTRRARRLGARDHWSAVHLTQKATDGRRLAAGRMRQ